MEVCKSQQDVRVSAFTAVQICPNVHTKCISFNAILTTVCSKFLHFVTTLHVLQCCYEAFGDGEEVRVHERGVQQAVLDSPLQYITSDICS